MAMAFLSAQWVNLGLISYAVPDQLLEPYLPTGLKLDRHNDSAFVSLVVFDFLQTKVLGVSWPGFRNFAEMNLRFYVRRGKQRGVVFIREIVPQLLVASLAKLIYNEPYVAAPLESHTTITASQLTVEHTLYWHGQTNLVKLTATKFPHQPTADSTEHFFKEHEWGFGQSRKNTPIIYRVEHPIWEVYPVEQYQLNMNWRAIYGAQWEWLAHATPYSVVLAKGSAVKVFPYQALPTVD